jgi:hypothetical protein
MKADVSNYDANIAKAKRTLEGFKQDNLTMGGILNQSTKSIVAAAAQYASFAAVLGTVAHGFSEAANKGMAMAREAEGVKMAFDRLNKPGLLENLREATHNTVNDLELMKQAVKFDNFNLSLEQMGTFLAFAQQQAKDTGQDVNYLVDSIVTGLGRKSLPILDNLGLSAQDIKERMKDTGDMTQAVAQIIEERMKDAGDYVETAADRAAQAQARLDNAMKDLGETFNSLSSSGQSLWSELEIGAINLANTAIKPLISLFNELASYIQGTSAENVLTSGMTDVTDTVDDNGRLIRKNSINKIPEIVVGGTAPKKTPRSGGGGKSFDIKSIAFNPTSDESMKYDPNQYFQSVYGQLKPENILGTSDAWESYKDTITECFNSIGESFDNLTEWTDNFEPFIDEQKKMKKTAMENAQAQSLAAQAVASFGAALAGLDDPGAKAAGTVLQALASIAMGFAMASVQAATLGPIGWIAWVAAGIAAFATMISTVHQLTGFAEGGIVKGNSYSGDNIYAGGAMVNAGEVVLNKAQQGNLASQLQGNGLQNLNVAGRIKGTDIILSVDRSLQLQGKQLLTWGR